MSSKSRWLVFLVSTPLVIIAAVGGLLATQKAPQQGLKDLGVFDDVVSLVMSSYVEKVDVDKVMEGAMRGLAEGLDASSAYLTAEEVKAIEATTPPPSGTWALWSRVSSICAWSASGRDRRRRGRVCAPGISSAGSMGIRRATSRRSPATASCAERRAPKWN